jgi:hypothetical protein
MEAHLMHRGRNQLIERLTWQVGDKDLAIRILQKRGHADANGDLTEAGKKRDAMTAQEREADRGDKPGSSNRQHSVTADAIRRMKM